VTNPAGTPELAPSDLLVVAADRIRDLAAAATPGPWQLRSLTDEDTTYSHTSWWVADADGGSVASMDHINEAADAAWVAALSPAVALHLEAWLRHAAASVETAVEGMGWPANSSEAAALRFALVLVPTGETQT
jgi:hypothetical protein